ncbi:MAG TPA: aminoglycoside phosphotransferase family protein [Thermomicrobiales bacterium]|nr:aminoglycoside phosphotransferase family protein [Thermomicrobiales bacterium]
MIHSLPQHAESTLKWLAEHGVIAKDAAREWIPAGTINTVIRTHDDAGETVYVRIGPPAKVIGAPTWMRSDALANEVLALDRIRQAMSCLPMTVAAGFRSTAGHWLVQKAVPGEPLDVRLPRLTVEERVAIWRELGELVRRLHEVNGPWFGTPAGDQRFERWPTMVRSDAAGLLDDARLLGLNPSPYERLLVGIDRHEAALRAVDQPSAVHSDLNSRHVFMGRRKGRWGITGIIDWEYARYVDPLSESLLVELLSRPEDDPDRAAFLGGYGFDLDLFAEPTFRTRQKIYRGIIAGWVATDAARLNAARSANDV